MSIPSRDSRPLRLSVYSLWFLFNLLGSIESTSGKCLANSKIVLHDGILRLRIPSKRTHTKNQSDFICAENGQNIFRSYSVYYYFAAEVYENYGLQPIGLAWNSIRKHGTFPSSNGISFLPQISLARPHTTKTMFQFHGENKSNRNFSLDGCFFFFGVAHRPFRYTCTAMPVSLFTLPKSQIKPNSIVTTNVV